MDNLVECKVDDVVDVKEIKVRKVQVRSTRNAQGLRTVKHKAVDIPITPIVEPTIKKHNYVSTDFILDFDDS